VKKTTILAVAGITLVAFLFIFGRTTELKNKQVTSPAKQVKNTFDIQEFIDSAKQKLTPDQALYVSKLENGIVRGDVPAQKQDAYNSLATFWKDSARLIELYAFYTAEAAKLDNSEKNLTFAAQLFLDNLRAEQDEATINWESSQAIELFERAIKLNPSNDELTIGLGSVYIFGRGRSGDPNETMKGIQQLLTVIRKDSNNMRAQLVLGIGGFLSAQYDKALERLQKVVTKEPGNLEAIAFLADTYAAKGDKAEAIKWYNISKRLANNPHYSEEVDARLKLLQ